MALFDQWPYVNIHDLNTDWLVKTVKAVKDLAEAIKEKTDDIDDSVARARDSAANAKISEDNAKNSEDAAKDYYDLTSALVGKPLSADSLADMTDTTTVYIYTGSEPGMTAGDWYYYDGNDWVSGGKYGGDGGINNNARNLLLYILDRVTYTEPGMEIYVNALYEELAHRGYVPTTFTITNALDHVVNSNSATGVNSGASYSATLTASAGYTIDTVSVTMNGSDVTSAVYDIITHTITIASITGDVVITASASYDPGWDFEWKYTMGLPNNNGLTITNTDGTVTMTAEGLSVTTQDSNSSSVIYKYESMSTTVQTKTVTELVFSFTAFSNQQGSGIRSYAGLGGTGGGGGTAKQIAQCSFSQLGVQYLGSNPGWSTFSATPLSLNTWYKLRIEQIDGSADIYLNDALIGTLTDFREAVAYPQFSIYRGAGAIIKSFKMKFYA